MSASLLPNGEQQFIDSDGVPLVGGFVYFYIPNTSTPKNTWQDAEQTILNTNPIVLDGRGQAIIYGSGEYRQIVKDEDGNLIWDQLTASPGDVLGPDSAVDGDLAIFDGVTGKLLKDTGFPVADVGDVNSDSSSSVVGDIVIFSGTDGKTISDSGVLLSAVYPPAVSRGASVYNSAAQIIPNDNNTALTFDTALINDSSIWSAGTPTRLTVPSGVTRVQFAGQARYDSVGGSDFYFDVKLSKNGSETTPCGFYQVTNSSNPGAETAINGVSAILPVSTGDYFEIHTLQRSGGSLTTEITQPGQNWFSMQIIK